MVKLGCTWYHKYRFFSFFSGDQCLMVDSNKVTIRGFEGFICLELPTAGSEDQVNLTKSDANDNCLTTVSLEQFF